MSRNRRNPTGNRRPLHKYVSFSHYVIHAELSLIPQSEGNGHELALAVSGQAGLPNYEPNANVGDVPVTVPWNPNIEGYHPADSLRLINFYAEAIIFYNNDFGIEAGDLVSVRRRKVI